MALLPIRSRVLQYMSTVPKANVTQVMDSLKSEYGSERQFTKPNFVDHLMALKANGLLDEGGCSLDSSGGLLVDYQINDEGRNTIQKFLPKKYRS